MTAIRLPDWAEILAPSAPWALLLRSGPAGVWLLRELAEEVEGLDVGVVDGRRCATQAGVVDEWALALGLDEPLTRLDALAQALAERCSRPAACGVLVTRADELLVDEPARLPDLLGVLRSVATAGGRALRVVFQAQAATDDRVAVLREFEVAEIA